MLTELRQAIASAVTSGVPDFQCTPYFIANFTPPSGYLYPAPTTFDLAMQRGLDEWHLNLRAYVGDMTDIGAQVTLDALLEPSGGRSLKAAIETDDTLGGLVGPGCCRVEGATGHVTYLLDGRGPLLGAEWSIRILAPGR